MKASSTGYNPDYSEDSPTIDQIRTISGYAVLEFGAPWCGHCRTASPAVREVLSELTLPHIKIYDGRGKRLGREFKVKLWPSLILLNSGNEVARLVRPVSVQEVNAFLAHIESNTDS